MNSATNPRKNLLLIMLQLAPVSTNTRAKFPGCSSSRTDPTKLYSLIQYWRKESGSLRLRSSFLSIAGLEMPHLEKLFPSFLFASGHLLAVGSSLSCDTWNIPHPLSFSEFDTFDSLPKDALGKACCSSWILEPSESCHLRLSWVLDTEFSQIFQ